MDMRRSAFTLIEMLVVIGIIAVLATLSVAIIPSVHQRTKAQRGADNTQGWFLVARERALRDHAPRGIRLLVDSDGYVRSMVFIEQPDPITGGALTPDTNSPTMNHVLLSNPPDVTGGQGANSALWPIQPGDYLQIQGGSSFLISQVDAANNGLFTQNAIWSQAVGPPNPTSNYLITRAPRQTAGEDVLRLPDDVVIDLSLSRPMGLVPPPYAASYDILFTPSGALTGTLGDGYGKIVLWLRDVTKDYPLPINPNASTGDQPLLVIYSRTGRIAAVQFNNDPNVGGGDPYFYTLDPRSSGL
jgi:prepilin-type N-terminal cleavage/methylation domain-containing protein